MSRWVRWWAGVVALGLTLAFAGDSYAASRILVLEFSGRKGEALREMVAQSLEGEGHEVVRGTSTSKGASKADLRRMAKSANADAIVDGRVRRLSMKSWSVTLTVHDGDNGRRVGKEVRFKNSWLPGLSKELADLSASRLEPSLKRAGPSTASRATRESPDLDDSSEPELADEPLSAEEPAATEVVAAVGSE
ncbi:MAG TPA: hypothetical protein VJU61_18910, partial [Polyangiaceae bacterium]|nr:hypothetical protein [Polyangiaceae bacterium]